MSSHPRSAALTPREIDEGDRLLTAGRQGELEEVRKLLKNGSEVDYKDLAGFSTLHFAAWKGHADVVAELLRAGAEIDAKNNYPGLTPLHRACQNGHLAVVRALLESGANKDLPDQFGDTPLHRACYDGHPAVVSELLGNGAAPDPPNNSGDTPIMQAARNGYTECVQALLATNRISLNEGNRHGRTALHWAAYAGSTPALVALLNGGAPINARNQRGFTPLHHAAENANLEGVKVLLNAGADPLVTQDAEDVSECRTPAALARAKGNDECAELLEQAMEAAIEAKEQSLGSVSELKTRRGDDADEKPLHMRPRDSRADSRGLDQDSELGIYVADEHDEDEESRYGGGATPRDHKDGADSKGD